MTITASKALLTEMANSLATEATGAGKTALATALTNFASEISATNDDDFFITVKFDNLGVATTTSGKGITYANMLQGAAAVVQSTTLNSIKTDHSTVATQTTAIAAAEATIATGTTTIAAKQTAIETYQKKIKELAEGSGVRMITPSELVGLAKLYQTMIEQGKILDAGDQVSQEQQANARAKFIELTNKVKDLIAAVGPPSF